MGRTIPTASYADRLRIWFLMTEALDFLMTEDNDYIVLEKSVINNYTGRTIPTTTYT